MALVDLDKWQEIWATVRKNPLRTFLTMFGVYWGIFMLLVLLGVGRGLEKGVYQEFSGLASNMYFVWGQRTTMPYKGFTPGKRVDFTTEDLQAVRVKTKLSNLILPQNRLGGWRGSYSVKRKNKTGGFRVEGHYPKMIQIRKLPMLEGRYVNPIDIEDKRKVAVIGTGVVEELYEPDEEVIGSYIRLNGIYFQVVGVTTTLQDGERADNETRQIVVPFTTFSQAFNYGNEVSSFAVLAKEGVPASLAEKEFKQVMRGLKKVHPDDEAAIRSFNAQREFQKITGLFAGIKIFVWIVGIGTLLAGIIGVSNIMLIVVRERTREIGIRKAIGATPFSVISLILQESTVIVLIAGYVGLLVGLALVEAIAYFVGQAGSTGMFDQPEVSIQVALSSLFILVFGGLLAGWLPARRAAAINPIEAIRTE